MITYTHDPRILPEPGDVVEKTVLLRGVRATMRATVLRVDGMDVTYESGGHETTCSLRDWRNRVRSCRAVRGER